LPAPRLGPPLPPLVGGQRNIVHANAAALHPPLLPAPYPVEPWPPPRDLRWRRRLSSDEPLVLCRFVIQLVGACLQPPCAHAERAEQGRKLRFGDKRCHAVTRSSRG